MQAIDRRAIEGQGVPSLDLMERAGQGVARVVEELAPDGPLVVVCGKGNNGGDGLVVARLLREAGRPVTVLCAAPPSELTGDAQANLARLPGEPPRLLADGASVFGGAVAIVDALLGTGFEGVPRGTVMEAIEAIGTARAVPVVSVDVPSGVDASCGRVAGAAVQASVTVTFHAAKPGLWVRPGKAFAGEVRTVDIGIPRGAPVQAGVGLIEPSVVGALPLRGGESTKFSSGHVVVAGGSRDLSGAPRMAALAAARAGAGYVTACLPASLQGLLAASLLEVMTRPLPDAGGDLEVDGVPRVLQALGAAGGALVLGPGLGRAPSAVAFARELAAQAPVAMVLDADGLNAHAAGRLGELAAREAPCVLTPHAGELGRLLECSSEDVQSDRLASARQAAERAQAVVVLKGDDTLVVDPSGLVAVSRGESPALATAGTGDVLSGVIAALLAQGLDAFRAACAAVWLHAEAGRVAADVQGCAEGVIASDVIAALPRARARGAA